MREQEPAHIHDVWGALGRALPHRKEVGGQRGWHAPSVQELKTLIDQIGDLLDGDAPSSGRYCSWQVSVLSGEPVTDQRSGTRRLWCVKEQVP
jgi:hypothetical protein